MTDTTAAPCLDQVTTVTVITPGQWWMAGARVAFVRTARMNELVDDLDRLIHRVTPGTSDLAGTVTFVAVWPIGGNDLHVKPGHLRPADLKPLHKLIDEFDERVK